MKQRGIAGMPTDREGREQRRGAIVEILRSGVPVASQNELVELLAERGIVATQSSVSRDLQDLGVVRVGGRYEINTWADSETQLQGVFHFVHRAHSAGPHLMVLTTEPGAAKVVALALENAHWTEIVGIVAEGSTIFIASEDVLDQKILFGRLRSLMTNPE
jgi:transcriptional regulator of arginine metabolism